jgi:hypothetical protein
MSSEPLRRKKTSVAAWPTRLFPSRNGWFKDQGVEESGGLVDQRQVKVGATERGSWLGEGRLQGAEVVHTGSAAGTLKDRLMKPDDLRDGEVAHQAKRR